MSECVSFLFFKMFYVNQARSVIGIEQNIGYKSRSLIGVNKILD